jgi:O-antigen ligase
MLKNYRPEPVFLLLLAGLGVGLFYTGTEGGLFFLSIALIWLALPAALILSREQISVSVSPLAIVLCLLLASQAVTLLWTPVAAFSQIALWRQSAVLVIFLTLQLSFRRVDWDSFRLLLFGVLMLLVGAALFQFLDGGVPRATFFNKNSLAGFSLPLLLWSFLPTDNLRHRRFQAVVQFAAGLLLGLIGSRGAILGFGLGLCVLALFSRRAKLGLRLWRRPAGLVIGGLLTSVLLTGFQSAVGVGRVLSLVDPAAAGAGRFSIWLSSIKMLETAPWSGIGVGVYGWIYPQYRAFADSSAGHFAHNDLLQIWVEAGIGGFLVALAAIGVFYWTVWRALGSSDQTWKKQELVVLTGGLSALLFHSMLTFNAYVFSILILVGILLARVQILVSHPVPETLQPEPRRKLLRLVAVLLCLFPLAFFLRGGSAHYCSEQALSAYRNGQTQSAFVWLARARTLWPSNDFNWYMEGEIVRFALAEGQAKTVKQKDNLLSYGVEKLQHAEKLNPYRPMIPAKLAQLKELDTIGTITRDLPSAQQLYRQAVRLEPRYIPARMALARLLEKKGASKRAHSLLENGLRYHYNNVPALIPLLEKTAAYRREAGNLVGAQKLEERSAKIRADWHVTAMETGKAK